MSVKTAVTIAVLGMCFAGSAQADDLFAASKWEVFDQDNGFASAFLGADFTQDGDVIVSAAIIPHSDDELDIQLGMDGAVQAVMAKWVQQDEVSTDITVAIAGAYLNSESETRVGVLDLMNGWSFQPKTDPNLAAAAVTNHRSAPIIGGYGVQVVDGRPIFDMQALGVQVADGRPIFETYDMMLGSPEIMAVSFNTGS